MTPLTEHMYTAAAPQQCIYDPNYGIKSEFNRLIHAAIINRQFRETLLRDPICAIENGYLGESFEFPNVMKNRIRQINVETLEEFSLQILIFLNAPKVEELAELHY